MGWLMHNFPRKRHWLLIMFLWVPAQVRNFADPALTWIGLLIAAGVGLLVAYMVAYGLTAGVRKLLRYGRGTGGGDA